MGERGCIDGEMPEYAASQEVINELMNNQYWVAEVVVGGSDLEQVGTGGDTRDVEHGFGACGYAATGQVVEGYPLHGSFGLDVQQVGGRVGIYLNRGRGGYGLDTRRGVGQHVVEVEAARVGEEGAFAYHLDAAHPVALAGGELVETGFAELPAAEVDVGEQHLPGVVARRELQPDFVAGQVAVDVHAYGLGVSVHTCLTNQYSLILIPKFKPKTFNNLIRSYNVTFFAGVPIMFKKMIQHKNFYGKHLQKLKDLWCGGDVLTESFVEHFDTILEKYNSSARLFRGYGLTEVSSVCAANTFENYKPFSCGKAIPNTKIEIWDEQNKPLKPKTIGEIAVASPSVMKGYLNEVNGFVYKDKLKWIKTGDMGYMDEEGFLYILDRRKRSIKINAINVFPSEIENLVKKIDEIDEACAVPYHFNDKTYIKLYITLKNKNEEDVNVEKIKKEILNLCKNNLIKYSVPRMIEVIDAMPRTDFGKIDFKKFEIS